MPFDLTDIRLFLTVVEEGSLTGGARAMNLALASASERVSRMEDALGTLLLERGRRGVRPTAAGDALVRHARSIVDQVERMRGELRRYATGLKGRIRLWSNAAALAHILPRKLCDFLADHADLAIDVRERPSAEIALALADGRADLGVVADIADLTALQARLLAQDRLVVVTSRRHRFHDKQSLDFSDIIEEPFVGLSDGALEIHLGEHAARLGRQIQHRIQLRGVEDIGMLVGAGVGIAVLSEAAVAHLRRPDLAVVPLSESWAVRQLYLCAREFSALPSHAHLLAQRLLENQSGSKW
jgi:DNA-binding transcriptional LysR family regulator